MRRAGLFAAAAFALITGQALAADLPRKAPPAPLPPPPFSWTGFYVGIHGGAGWGTGDPTLLAFTGGPPFNVPLGQVQANGWLVGGTIGYNWQANPWLVLGVEGEFTWNNIEGTSACLGGGGGFSCTGEGNWKGDLTGRIGFSVDRALIYLKGGVVWANTDYTFTFNPGTPFSFTTSDTRVGGLLGAGVEYAFLPNWSAKIEYNYMDFGTQTETFATANIIAPVNIAVDIRQVEHAVKFGVNYRFNWR